MKTCTLFLTLSVLLATIKPDSCTKKEEDLNLTAAHRRNGIRNDARRPFATSPSFSRRKTLSTEVSRSARQYGLEWWGWRKQHNKHYVNSQEELERYVVWRSNTAYINSHNVYADRFGFSLAMNKYGDMTSAEYSQSMRCVESSYYRPPFKDEQHDGVWYKNVTYFDGSKYSNNLPDELDWRTKGAVSRVKDQGRCKSCYAFATTAALEGMHALATGNLVPLSEQNIIDCSIPYGNRGCSGGSRMATIMYAVDNGGIDSTSSYPYRGRQYLCKFTEESIATGCTGMVRIKRGNEQDLKKAVAVVGPVTAAVDSRHTSFQFYAKGIYSEPSCSRTKLTHSMIITGYGSKNGHDYWLLKNSWGTSWGENGYVKMSRNYANQCGIATKAMYTTI